ncbi:MAG: phenylalanine--tRNA ligase subunit beta [Candidatus Hydrogenedentes bacterium]|nr:phenylalanine--tRNA ligase subunit beta [Candidatus Hydrogenedentota bacterium]
MRVSLNWLKEYVNIDVSSEELAHQMTMLGLEIESIEQLGGDIKDVFVGQILSIEPHPDADKIVVCQTDVGGETALQICCGAKNMKVGDKVPTAVVGASLPGGFEIARRKMRGVESQGMMCASTELGLPKGEDGLLILDPSAPVGMNIKTHLGLDDTVLEIEVTPNRADWASMIGVARELAALYNTELRIPEVSVAEEGSPVEGQTSVTVEAADLCPRYMGRVLSNVKVGPSPEWLCKRLIAAGQRPINNIVDITNFVLLETGQPLHAFDLNKLAENCIVVRRAKAGETINTLDGEKRNLAEDMLVIAEGKDPQCVAGVMGGADSEVDEGTTTIFLESAFFHPASVRKTSRGLALISESSQRFQRGADPEMAAYALDRAAQLMAELSGAEVARGVIDAYPVPFKPREVTLRFARTLRLLGVDLAAEVQCGLLQRLGLEVIARNDHEATFRVPLRRHDVSMEADLIEEVARLYSFDNIPVTLPTVRRCEKVFAPEEARIRALRHFLAGLGLTELYNWSFSCPEDVARAALPAEYANMVVLQNPLSEKQATMRSSLLQAHLGNAARNLNYGVTSIAGFEIGPVYVPADGDALPSQARRVGIVLAGNAAAADWSQKARPADFYDLKGLVEAVLAEFGVSAKFEETDFPTFQKGQRAAIVANKKTIGYLGKAASAVVRAFDTEGSIYLAELDLDVLLGSRPAASQFAPVPTFPPSVRDLAVVVDAAVPAGGLRDMASQSGGNLLRAVEIFDIFTGPQVGEGKKSVALNLVFQSNERTLTDQDTQKAFDKILKRLQHEYKAELR